MKKQVRLYNVILPIWLLVLFPQAWLLVIPGNLAVDCLVLLLALRALKHPGARAVLRQVWWQIWLLGFAADFVGVIWMALAMVPVWCFQGPFSLWWEEAVIGVMYNAFAGPVAFVWTLSAVVLAGVCIYWFDRRVLRACPLLTDRESRITALTMAVVTAPWLFFLPVS